MKILVIGNGFDLEHELPTNYIDFLRYIKRIRIIKDYSKDDSQKVYIEKLLENDETFKEYALRNFTSGIENKRIEELINLCNNNDWIKYFEDSNFNENKGWIDFEGEISHVIRSLDYMKKYRHETRSKKDVNINKNKDYSDTEKRIERITGVLPKRIEFLNKDEYNQKITKKLQENLENLIRCLELYLEDYVAKKDINYISPDIQGIKFDKVLSFNYTNTYERIYGLNNNEIEYHYIHGKADIDRTADDNNMVLGIDEYLNDEVKNKELEFITFKKYFQRIYKKTGNTYKKWILQMKDFEYESTGESDELGQVETQKIKNEVYIFGHSLDITDKDILKELIECPNTVTTIFYYNKEVYAQQITNLVKVIGQDELIQRVSGANPTIIFKQQQKRIVIN